jgi:hypothetical protein
MSIKSTIKSFIEPKNIYTLYSSSSSNVHSPSHTIDSFNISIQLNHIAKMIEECVYAFTKRYLIVSTELEEMKREFIGQSSTINEYLQLTKKEIRFDKFDKFNQGKHNISIPQCPIYEQKCLIKHSKTNSNTNIHLNSNNMRYTTVLHSRNGSSNTKKGSSSLKKSKSRLISPEISKKINNKVKQKLSVDFDTASSSNKKKLSFNNSSNNNQQQAISNHTEYNVSINTNKLFNLNTKRNNRGKLHPKPPCKTYDNSAKTNILVNKDNYNNNNVINIITSPKTKALYIAINKSEVFTLNEKIILSYLNKDILSHIHPKQILLNSIDDINNRIHSLETNTNSIKDNESINKLISYPSNTAKTGLNFLSKHKEKELMSQSDDKCNKELLKMIITCLDVDESVLNVHQNPIENVYAMLFDMFKVHSIKSLFCDVIYNKIYYNSNNINIISIDKIIKCIDEHKELITNVLKDNNKKCFSYIMFSFEEINEYLKELMKLQKDSSININELNKRIITQRQIEELNKLKNEINDKLNKK